MDRRSQPALIFSDRIALWTSSAFIARNLRSAYKTHLGTRFQSFHFSRRVNANPIEVFKLANRIFQEKPDKIIFIDDVVTPERLLIALEQTYGTTPLPPLYFHLYGNFTLNTRAWLRTQSILNKSKTHFICSSERQGKLVRQFLKDDQGILSICPFPVSSSDYSFDPDLRTQFRTKLGIADNEIILLYTGRLSLQKNITRLTEEIIRIMKTSDLKLKLFLAGSFEDGGVPFFEKTRRYVVGHYYQRWQTLMENTAPEHRSRIRFLGPQTSSQLKGIYNAADIFVSLSLYHDEDYGMSPAEGLVCGLPAVLTDWGGFAGFDFFPRKSGRVTSRLKNCSLIPVHLEPKGLLISSESFQETVLDFAKTAYDMELRTERSQFVEKYISISAAAQRLGDIHSKQVVRFPGFSSLMKQHVKALSSSVPFPNGPKKGTFYEKIYGSYLR